MPSLILMIGSNMIGLEPLGKYLANAAVRAHADSVKV